jgi:hydrogenase expression/formation protein HypC
MCIGIPMTLQVIDYPYATGIVDGVQRDINLSLIAQEEINIGDIVLVHAGFGVTKVDQNYVDELRKTIAEIESKSANPYKSW